MNHEHESREQLPTIKDLFRRAGEIAVLHGRIEDTDNENETLRQFILADFPKATKQKWPQLREIIFTPSYMIDYAPSGDMVSITLADTDIRSHYMLHQTDSGEYIIDVDHSPVEELDTPDISEEERVVSDNAIKAAFNDGPIQSEAEDNLVDKIDFLLTRDMTATPEEILMLDEIIASLAAQYPRK